MKITGKEFEAYSYENEVLSDMDFGYNPETENYDVPMLELDGIYGKRWVRFESEEKRSEYLERYNTNMENWVVSYRVRLENKIKDKKRKKTEINNLKTLGGQFPELGELLKQVS